MSTDHQSQQHIAVIGGGITGLAAAHRLRELAPSMEISLFEGSDRIGGILQTEQRENLLIEKSADMFLATPEVPWAKNLCQRLGLAAELVPTRQERRGSHVVFRGRLVPVPEGFQLMAPARAWPIATSPLLSPAGKLRLARERFVPPRRDGEKESLEQFAVRRFGRQAYERIIQPMVGGIYTADPARLSVAAALPQFVEMERKYGSVTKGVMQRARRAKGQPAHGARYGAFLSLKQGMTQLVDALVASLPTDAIQRNRQVVGLSPRGGGGWEMEIAGEKQRQAVDGVVAALPAGVAGRLVGGFDGELADSLAAIPYAGASIVVNVYRRDQLPSLPRPSFGFVVPIAEQRKILAASFSSEKFPGRAPDDTVIVRTFVGGALQPELLELDDTEVCQLVRDELEGLIGASGEPLHETVVRWRGAMPQYHVGHLGLVDRIEERTAGWRGLELAGAAYRGVGIPQCIRSGESAAERLVEQVRTARG